MTDFFGRQMKRGDFFVLAVRSGNMAEVKVGIVTDPARGRAWLAEDRWGGKLEVQRRESHSFTTERGVIVTEDSLPADTVKLLKSKVA